MSSDAIVILKADHKEIRDLFRKFQAAGDKAVKTKEKIAGQIIELLTVHTYIENEVMYPEVCALLPDLKDDVLESYEEHHVAGQAHGRDGVLVLAGVAAIALGLDTRVLAKLDSCNGGSGLFLGPTWLCLTEDNLNCNNGFAGLTGVTPLTLYRDWIVQTARQWGSAL